MKRGESVSLLEITEISAQTGLYGKNQCPLFSPTPPFLFQMSFYQDYPLSIHQFFKSFNCD